MRALLLARGLLVCVGCMFVVVGQGTFSHQEFSFLLNFYSGGLEAQRESVAIFG